MSLYTTKSYLNNQRVIAYLEQFKYVEDNDVVLEFGKGAGIFMFLASRIAKYYCVDVDYRTNPDYIGDVSDKKQCAKLIGLGCNKIFCCQVLEHLPLELSMRGLENLLSINAEKVCISLPDNRRYIRMNIELPIVRLKKVFSIPFTGKKITIDFHAQHFWEIYSKNFKQLKQMIKKIAGDRGYKLSSEYRLFERPYQHFFIFERSDL